MKKPIVKKIFWLILSFLLLETFVILALVSLNVVTEYKLDLTSNLLIDQFSYTFTHLGTFVKSNWEERNAFFIGGTVISFLYAIFTSWKGSSKKEGWKTEDQNTYHGSARWARTNEIFDNHNFLNKSKGKVLNDFEKSLQKGEE